MSSSSGKSSSRPTLPFGLGRDAVCSGDRCTVAPAERHSKDKQLPQPGTRLHDQAAQALSDLFVTFFTTSLTYLGVSEILDWVEQNQTVDAWILTGLEQGRPLDELASQKNLAVGKGAIKSVIKAALEQDDHAWAHSLRQVGFSSGMSMAYEGIVSQLKTSKNAPLPCLHSLLTPSGLAMLKSAPLKQAFPLCPPRSPPSPAHLFQSIRSLIAAGTLKGPQWKHATTWRPMVRRTFNAYHAIVRQVAEQVVTDPEFAKEYTIFLESIAQPIPLFQLIADDFENEFGPGACKGLLAVGDVGGHNMFQIMDFCAAQRPSELLARVKARVAEKQEREKTTRELLQTKKRLEELSQLVSDGVEGKSTEAECERVRLEMDRLEKTIKKAELAAAKFSAPAASSTPANTSTSKDAAPAAAAPGPKKKENECTVGSSKDLIGTVAISDDPFASTAPRAVLGPKVSTNKKGKAKALATISNRLTSRTLPIRPLSPANSSHSPASSRAASPVATRTAASTLTHKSHLSQAQANNEHTDDEHGTCCSACAAEMLQSTMAPLLGQRPEPSATEAPVFSKDHWSAVDDQRSAVSATVNADVESMHDAAIGTAVTGDAERHETEIPILQAPPMQVEMSTASAATVDSTVSASSPSPSANKKKKKKSKGKSATKTVNGDVGTNKAVAVPSNATHPVEGEDNDNDEDDDGGIEISVEEDEMTTDPIDALPTEPVFPSVKYDLPKCCPPHWHTGVKPDYSAWPKLEKLLHETFVAGFKYELIDNLSGPLEVIRDDMARQYVLMGGKMTDDDGKPRDMRPFLQLTAKAGMFKAAPYAIVHNFLQRTLALSMQKVIEVLRCQVDGRHLCICTLSRRPDILVNARDRLEACELADRQIPIELPSIDQQSFMKWAHVKLRNKELQGKEWEGVSRSYRVTDYLFNFADAFDVAIDDMIENDPYVMASDLMRALDWVGGIRTLDVALRLSPPEGHGLAKINPLIEPSATRPLQSWNRLLELGKSVARSSAQSPSQSQAFDVEAIAEREKRAGNAYWGTNDFKKALVSFSTAALLKPDEPTYWTNAAAARLKLATRDQFSQAVADCSFALEHEPNNPKALYRRGLALAMIGRKNDAIRDLSRLVELCPDNEPAKEMLAWAQLASSPAGGAAAAAGTTKTDPARAKAKEQAQAALKAALQATSKSAKSTNTDGKKKADHSSTIAYL